MVVSSVEHAAVREDAKRLQREGFEVSWIGVDADGVIDPDEFAAALRPDTALAAIIWANNEVGTIEPVHELAETVPERDIPFHTDAVQAAGRVPIDVSEMPVSTLALSGHKLYGPQGVGALYVRGGVSPEPMVYGGGQEKGLRSGTQNVAGIVGLGRAARLAREEMDERVAHERALRDRILAGAEAIPDVTSTGIASGGCPTTSTSPSPASRPRAWSSSSIRSDMPSGAGRLAPPAGTRLRRS